MVANSSATTCPIAISESGFSAYTGRSLPRTSLMVHIFTQRGRTQEEKQDLYRTLSERLAGVGVDGKDLFISYFENGPEDWSFADGRAQYVEGDLPVPGR
jgi:hypothetical protein